MKPQISRRGLLTADVHTNLSFHVGILWSVFSDPCLDNRKTRQSGFDFIYLPWDDCAVAFLTSEGFSIFMEYHSRPCSAGNLLLSPSFFTRQLQRTKQENNDSHCLGKSLAGLHSSVYLFVIHTRWGTNMAGPQCLNMRLRKHTHTQKTRLENKKVDERIESFAVSTRHHEIAKISLFQQNPPSPSHFFPPLQPDQYNLISFQSRSL